jgi:hypothetical protein
VELRVVSGKVKKSGKGRAFDVTVCDGVKVVMVWTCSYYGISMNVAQNFIVESCFEGAVVIMRATYSNVTAQRVVRL